MDPVIKELRECVADYIWIDQNKEVLLTQYNGQCIGVKIRQVVASDPTFEGLRAKVRGTPGVCVDFVTRDHLEMIL